MNRESTSYGKTGTTGSHCGSIRDALTKAKLRDKYQIHGSSGTRSDYQGVQGTLPGDGKTLYLGCGGGHMTASERCTLEKVSFTTHH